MGMAEMVDVLDLREADRTRASAPFDEWVWMMVDHAYEEKRDASVVIEGCTGT